MIEINWKDDHAILTGEQMDPALIFNCGQAFRFEEEETGIYGGIAYGRQIWCRKTGQGMELFPTTPKEVGQIWSAYFDLDFAIRQRMGVFLRMLFCKRRRSAALGFGFCARNLLRHSLPLFYPQITISRAFGASSKNYARWQGNK